MAFISYFNIVELHIHICYCQKVGVGITVYVQKERHTMNNYDTVQLKRTVLLHFTILMRYS